MPGTLSPRPFPRMLASLGPGPSGSCSRGFAPPATSPLPWQPGMDTPVLPPTWQQHQCTYDLKVNVVTHYCTTITLDHISSTKIYIMWREEHLQNVNVLQRVHLFKFVLRCTVEYLQLFKIKIFIT
jgi:hypothetical protein